MAAATASATLVWAIAVCISGASSAFEYLAMLARTLVLGRDADRAVCHIRESIIFDVIAALRAASRKAFDSESRAASSNRFKAIDLLA